MLVLSLLFFDKDALIPVGKYKKLAKETKVARSSSEAQTTASNAENKNVDTAKHNG